VEYKLGAIDKEIVAAKAMIIIEKGASEREALKIISEKYNITDWRIRGAIHSLVFEVLRRLNLIDALITKTLQKGTIEKLYPLLRNLLRIGVYIIKFTDTPPPKITKQIVEETKNNLGKNIAKLSNALLRQIEQMKLADVIKANSTDTKDLSLKYYHPPWFIDYLINLIGYSNAIKFLEKSLEPNQLFIRLNPLKADLPLVIEDLIKEKYSFEVDKDLPDIIKITKSETPIIHSSLYQKGLIYIQDKASALVSHIVDPQEGDTIFDLCAAPGGKSMHLGQLMNNTGMVFAFDRSHRRLLELTTKLMRYDLLNIYVLNAQIDKKAVLIRKKADKILIDPPCSGTGTFISRPYSKWKLQPKDIEMLTEIQWNLLTTAVKLLNTSGEIIYSTCSITLEENEQLIKKFLAKFPDFSLVPTNPFIGVPGFLELSETQRLFPHLHDTEGFFISKLKRN